MARDSLGINGDLAKLVQHRQWQYDTAATPERRRSRWKKLQEAVRAQQRSEKRSKKIEEVNRPSHKGYYRGYVERQAAIRAEIESLRYLPIEERWSDPNDGHDHVWRYSEDAPNRYVMRCAYCYLPEKPELRYSPEPGPRREFI